MSFAVGVRRMRRTGKAAMRAQQASISQAGCSAYDAASWSLNR